MKIRRAGFTLIELMMAMLAGAIMALVVGSILVFGYQGWADNNRKVELQRDASLAMEAVGRQLRQAKNDDGEVHLSANGKTLYFDASERASVAWQGDQLILNPSGMVLVRNGLLNFEVDDDNGDSTWDVILQLYDAGSGASIVMTGSYTPRNKTVESDDSDDDYNDDDSDDGAVDNGDNDDDSGSGSDDDDDPWWWWPW